MLTSDSAQHNSSTSLLKLPPEIKNKIYELLCGGQLLHLDQCWIGDTLQFTHEICQAGLSEQAADDLFNADTTAQWFVGAVETRHSGCFTNAEHIEKIGTSFLATCRQVYNEARHIPYSTNTFGFSKTSILDRFSNHLKTLGSGQHLEIRRVHLDVTARAFNEERLWQVAITQYLIPRLPAVQRISINLNQWYHAGVIGCRTPAEFEARHRSGNYLMSALLELRKLPLSRATFVISDAEILWDRRAKMSADLIPQYRWTLAEKKVWARYIKDIILQKDNQHATPSTTAVEKDTVAGKMVLGLESSGKEQADWKLGFRRKSVRQL